MTNQDLKLYQQFAQCYDWHTPMHHYQHDHKFVIDLIKEIKINAKLLDIGCGTGFFIEKALADGLDPKGLDSSKPMLEIAMDKVAPSRLIHASMQSLDVINDFDAITALSWSINYCADEIELLEVLTRFYNALKEKGILIIQTANAENAEKTAKDFLVDIENGPDGASDVVFSYRFWSEAKYRLKAQYKYRCISTDQSFCEIHNLNVADAKLIGALAKDVGFSIIKIVNDWSNAPLTDSISPFVIAYKLQRNYVRNEKNKKYRI